MEESMILQSLREEGLITRPKRESTNFATFEIVAANTLPDIRPPPRLEKLERRRKKKKQLTEDEIKEKLERAERRKRVSSCFRDIYGIYIVNNTEATQLTT